MATTLQEFFTVDALMVRWGVTRETILGHVDSGRLGFVDLSPAGVKRRGRGPRQIGFMQAHVLEFETARSARWGDPEAPAPAITSRDWDGVSRIRPVAPRRKKA